MTIEAPDFFIIGAPKCGTTALSEYLKTHPDILFSDPKEPHYFSTDILISNNYSSFEEYMATCFPVSERKGKLLGEGSVWYLYSEVAVQNILNIRPDAKFIVMLRNPVEMAHSLYYQAKFTLDEDSLDFEDAWKKQNLRLNGKSMPAKCRDANILQYKKVCSLGSQLERVMKNVTHDQLKVIIFDDFTKNTKEVYDEVLSFLQLPEDGRTDFLKINEAKEYRSSFFGQLIVAPPEGLLKINSAVKKILGLNKTGLRNFIQKLAVKKVSKNNLNKDFKKKLLNEFASDIELIEMLLNRNLSHWR